MYKMYLSLHQQKEQNNTMNKNKQKREKYHPLAVKKIAEMYGFSARYVRQILKGDRKGLMADNVLRNYKELCNEIDQATEQAVENIINQ